MSDEITPTVVRIANADDAKTWAEKLGIELKDKGRAPTGKIWKALVSPENREKYTIDPTGYFNEFGLKTERPLPSAPRVKAAPKEEKRYTFVRTGMVTKVATKGSRKGKEIHVPGKEEVTLTISEIRELSGTTGARGRLSTDAVRTALKALREAGKISTDWTDEDIESQETPGSVKGLVRVTSERLAELEALEAALKAQEAGSEETSGQETAKESATA